jgi:two-component system response regulator (stage 0 sporulation protein F)
MPEKTILIVEDDDDLRNMLYLLFSKDYNVLEAADGHEALGLYISEKPDLVITDNRMPRITGLQFAILMHEEKRRRRIPVVMITAYKVEPSDLRKANIDAFIEKPFDPSDLRATVERLLNGSDSTPV